MLEVFQPEKKCKIGNHPAQMVKLFVPETLAMKLTSLKTVLIKLQVICISNKLIIAYYHLNTRELYAPKSKSVLPFVRFYLYPNFSGPHAAAYNNCSSKVDKIMMLLNEKGIAAL